MNPQQWPGWQDHRNYRDTRNMGAYPGAGGFNGEFGYSPVPYGGQQIQQLQQLPAVTNAAPASGASGLLGNFNFKDIKSVVDRLGGIDGIMSTVGKVQKIVSNFQQMQPMLKLLMNMLPGKAKTTGVADDSEGWKKRPRRRKRRRKGKKKSGVRPVLYTPGSRRRGRGRR